MAPRPASRPWGHVARGAGLAAMLVATGATAQTITGAAYGEPTTRYPHGALGDDLEWGALILSLSDGSEVAIRLPQTRVFEDVAPRLVDVDLDGSAEVIAVESDAASGARLAIYDAEGLMAATPFIGTRNRWLAPLGAADLDGDGHIEIAYVDRPHLAKVLRVWRYRDGALTEAASAAGHTNHRFGEPDIGGGIRDCGEGPEIITARGDWSRALGTRFLDGTLVSRDIGPWTGGFETALRCD